MFKKILVALDGTPEAASIVPVARALASARYAEVVLVRITADYHESSAENIAARQYLDGVVREYALDQLQVRTELRYGDVAEQLLAAARESEADLIAMATHGRHGLARAWFGSVAEHVLTESPVPVLVLRADAHPPAHLQAMLVPVDNSPGSAAALAVARDLAIMTSARLKLLQVVPPLPRWGRGEGIVPEWEEDTRAAAEAFLKQLAARLRAQGVAAEGEAAIGPVAETIGHVAREGEADLIVMSTHALIGPRRALLGSVADAVMRTAGIPVLLIRQHDDRPAAGQESPPGEPATP